MGYPLSISVVFLFRAHFLFLLAFLFLLQIPPTSATTTTTTNSPSPASKTASATPKATPIYINALPAYSALPPCAEAPLSNIVRNMWSGCGDGSQLTSFSCFCTDSYSKFSWEISTAVVGSCGGDDDDDGGDRNKQDLASSAVGVFHEYCTKGSEQLTSALTAAKSSAGSSMTIGEVSASTTGTSSAITSTSTNPFLTAETQTSSAMTNGISTLYVLLVSAMAVLLDSLGFLVFV